MEQQKENYLYIDRAQVRSEFALMPEFPVYKRIWRLLILIIKGHCYLD